MISVTAFLCLELVGAAALALWVVARFPSLGPTSLRTALALSAAALLLLRLSSVGVIPLVGLPQGVYIALFGCVLPCFFAAFLAAAWLMRVLAGSLGGSSGGGGHPVRS